MYKRIHEIRVKEHELSGYFDHITHNTWVSFGRLDTHLTLEVRDDKKHRLKEGKEDVGYIEKEGDKVMFRPNDNYYHKDMFYGNFDVSDDFVFLVCVKHYNNEKTSSITMSILKVGENLMDNKRPFQVKNVVVYPTEDGTDYTCDLLIPFTDFNFTGYATTTFNALRGSQLKM